MDDYNHRVSACSALLMICIAAAGCSDPGQTGGDQPADARDTTSATAPPDGSTGSDGTDSADDDANAPPDGSEQPDTTGSPDEAVVVPGARRAVKDTASAVDSAGTRLVAFYDKTHEDLRLARKPTDGSWSVSSVDGVSLAKRPHPLNVELAVDDDRPHLAYLTPLQGLKYARLDGGSWRTEVVDEHAHFAGLLRLRIDSSGAPHLVHAPSTGTRAYDRSSEGDWTEVRLPGYLETDGEVLDFELDAQDTSFILYRIKESPRTAGKIRLASKQSSGWEDILVAEPGDIRATGADLRFGEGGEPEVAYRDNSGELVVATRDSGDWAREFVELTESLTRLHSFHRNSEGEGRLLYQTHISNESGGSTSRVLWARETPTGWETERLPPDGHRAVGAAAHYSPSSGPSITFIDRRYRNVNWAKRDSGQWTSEPLEHERVRVVKVIGLALDSRQRPVVLYRHPDRDDVWIARWRDGEWIREQYEARKIPGSVRAVAGPFFDDDDRTQFVFSNANGWHLYSARRDGEGWTSSAIDTSTKADPKSLALSVDPTDTPHVLYQSSGDSTDSQMHAWREESSWKSEELGALKNISTEDAPVEFEVDRRKGLHVVGINDSHDIVYNIDRGDGWMDETVDDALRAKPAQPRGLTLDGDGQPNVIYQAFREDRSQIVHALRRDGNWTSNPALPVSPRVEQLELVSGTGDFLYTAASAFDEFKLAKHSAGEWTEFEWTYESSRVRTHTWDIALSDANERYIAFSNLHTENLVVTRVSQQ